MPNFISLLQSELGNSTHWVFAQEAATRAQLEAQNSFNGISRIRKNTEQYRRSPNAQPRIISGNVAGAVVVITHERVPGPASASTSFGLVAKAAKKAVPGKKTAKKTKKSTPKKKIK